MTEEFDNFNDEYLSFEDYLIRTLISCKRVIQSYKNLTDVRNDEVESIKDILKDENSESIRNATRDSVRAARGFTIDTVIHYDNLFDFSSFTDEKGELDFEAIDRDSHNEELNKKRKANYDAAAFPVMSKVNEIIESAKAFFQDTSFTKSISALNIACERNNISDIIVLAAITISAADSANAALLTANADWHYKYGGANIKTLSKLIDANNSNSLISDDVITGAAKAAYGVSVYVNKSNIAESTLAALAISSAYAFIYGAEISEHEDEDCVFLNAAPATVISMQLKRHVFPQ